eukprot:gene16543-22772_t
MNKLTASMMPRPSDLRASPRLQMPAAQLRIMDRRNRTIRLQSVNQGVTSSSTQAVDLAPSTSADEAYPESFLKVIGVGGRGANAIRRLQGSGKVKEADFMAIDSDKKVLAACGDAMIQTLEVAQSDDVTLGLEDLLFVADGPTSVPPEAKDGGAGECAASIWCYVQGGG